MIISHTYDTFALEMRWRYLLPLAGLTRAEFQALLPYLSGPTPRGRPWSLTLPARLLLVLIQLRTNLTTRALAALFRTSQSSVDRIIHDLTPRLARLLGPDGGAAVDTAVHIIDGTLVPVHDQSLTAASKNYRRSINTQIVVSAVDRTVTAVSPAWPGNRNDIVVARAELDLNNYGCLLGDGGYQGLPDIETPRRGPDGRIVRDHAWRRHRRIRASVEHVIARLKDWQCLRQFRRRGVDAIN